MGCASSKVLECDENAAPKISRGISMKAHQQERADDFHIVALTSSTYGILKLDHQDPTEEEFKDEADPVKEMMRRLSNLENGGEAAPQSWHEVSSLVENLKPGLEKIGSAKQPVPAVGRKVVGQITSQHAERPESMVSKVIEKVKDKKDNGASSQAKVTPERPRQPKPFNQSLRIRTLEELDSRRLEQSVSVESPEFQPEGPDAARSSREKDLTALEKNDSGLFDAGFWGSYQKSLTDLSEDDWVAVDDHECSKPGSRDSRELDELTIDVSLTSVTSRQASIMDAASVESEKNFPQSEVKPCGQSFLPSGTPSRPGPAEGSSQKSRSVLEKFEDICPPEGARAIVLYTTSLRGIRKTYESCNQAREILQSLGIPIDERDVSLHLEFRNELGRIMGKVVTVPRLFITGKYIGGAEEIARLHEEGKLAELLDGFPTDLSLGGLCDGCGGSRFLPCFDCKGSCKVASSGSSAQRCSKCNENGLILCPLCS